MCVSRCRRWPTRASTVCASTAAIVRSAHRRGRGTSDFAFADVALRIRVRARGHAPQSPHRDDLSTAHRERVGERVEPRAGLREIGARQKHGLACRLVARAHRHERVAVRADDARAIEAATRPRTRGRRVLEDRLHAQRVSRIVAKHVEETRGHRAVTVRLQEREEGAEHARPCLEIRRGRRRDGRAVLPMHATPQDAARACDAHRHDARDTGGARPGQGIHG
jgi:hypothetical protein